MSKVNIRFIYRSQQDQEVKSVKSTHRGPVNLSNLYETYSHPSYYDIGVNNANPKVNQNKIQQNAGSFISSLPIIPKVQVTVQVNLKPTSPKFRQTKLQSPRSIASQTSFPLQLRHKKGEKNQNSQSLLNIDQTYESELIKKPQSKKLIKKEVQTQVPEGQIVLKAPSFKFVPKQEGELNSGNRKEYIRAQKAAKYLYKGIPQKSEDDFIGCFGCFQKKPKTFRANHK